LSLDKISDYAFISDCHSGALVSSSGAIDWLCVPRFDSPSVFGRLLDPSAGYWKICPTEPATAKRQYLENTLVLETTFETSNGVVQLTDAMALGVGDRGHDIGRGVPHTVIRSLICVDGEMQLEVHCAPRLDYGLIVPVLERDGNSVQGRGGDAVVHLSTPLLLDLRDGNAVGRFTLKKGQQLYFALQFRTAVEEMPVTLSQDEIANYLTESVKGWQSWSGIHQHYVGPWRDLVLHSGRVLQGLTYFPTGAIVAAATTSLPEVVGGNRNWDYRFTWVRDASFTMEALWVAACPDEATKFFSFLAGAALTQVHLGNDLQIMFGVGGESDLTERILPHLAGWRNSQPVRVGNDAWNQRQLDVYGELLSAVSLLSSRLADMADSTREFLVDVVDAAASRWQQKDQGIWEMRGEPRHFLYSKLMCWVALDRALRVVDLLKAEGRVSFWSDVSNQIRESILEHGWSEKASAFTQSYGSDDLDASSLMMAIVGFLPPTDPRILQTIGATVAHLTDAHGLVRRYASNDGLEGTEGSFLLCTFWLAHAQALAGLIKEARATFEVAISFANDVGLLSEEIHPTNRELIGNFPQAFSHIGLINAAWAIAQAGIDNTPNN
jgi:GH15 family glucan-1,4-alpha-glucosidase